MRSTAREPEPWLTRALVALIVGIYALTSFPQFVALNPTWALWGAYYTGAVQHGEWYRLITSGLLHANGIHLLLNAVILYQMGGMVERMVGAVRIGLIYSVSALTCLGASALVLAPTQTTLGASGMGFGVVGAYAVLVLVVTKRHGSPEEYRQQVRAALSTLALLLLLTVGMGFLGDGFNHAGHLGGFVGGALVTWLMLAGRRPATGAAPSADPLSPGAEASPEDSSTH
ncbi:MAG: rhomboid family intramembrane serine protease [Candidatus Melainabacteria bacterium]